MITARMMQGGVDVRLPRAEARPLEPKSGLVVTVDREGRIFMDQAALSYADFRATFPAFVRTKRPTGVYLRADGRVPRSEEHTSELQSPCNLVCRLLLEKKKRKAVLSRFASTDDSFLLQAT